LAIKGRLGNLVTKYPIKKIELKEKGISTLLPRKVWFDETVQRLNVDGGEGTWENLDQAQNFNYFANWKIKSNYTGIIDILTKIW
jgi:hypothetical protein